MKAYICIDDTDNLDSKGTGEIAEIIANSIKEKGLGSVTRITRHQLLVHPDIPYTSHNSSMCFIADTEEKFIDNITKEAVNVLKTESAEGSDPGLCVAAFNKLQQHEKLIDFGKKAKTQVLKKEDAYELAKELGIHLSEHGGTGQGVIGALAGVGLRMTGNDGRFKGKYILKAENDIAKVRDIFEQTNIEVVQSIDGQEISDEEEVLLGEKIKTVLLKDKEVLLVCPSEGLDDEPKWQICPMKYLKKY